MFDKITINLDRAYLPLNPTNIANYLTDVTEEASDPKNSRRER